MPCTVLIIDVALGSVSSTHSDNKLVRLYLKKVFQELGREHQKAPHSCLTRPN